MISKHGTIQRIGMSINIDNNTVIGEVTHLAPKWSFRIAYVNLRLLSDGVRTGLGSAFSFLRICESREGPRGGLGIAVDGRSWEEEPESGH